MVLTMFFHLQPFEGNFGRHRTSFSVVVGDLESLETTDGQDHVFRRLCELQVATLPFLDEHFKDVSELAKCAGLYTT